MFEAAGEPLGSHSSGWVYRSDTAPAAARPAGTLPPPADDAPRQSRCPVAGIDRLVSPFALALTIVLAPFGRFGRPR